MSESNSKPDPTAALREQLDDALSFGQQKAAQCVALEYEVHRLRRQVTRLAAALATRDKQDKESISPTAPARSTALAGAQNGDGAAVVQGAGA